MDLKQFDGDGTGRITFDASGEWLECWNNGQKVYFRHRPTSGSLHDCVGAALDYHRKCYGFLPAIDKEVQAEMDRQDNTLTRLAFGKG